MENNEKEVVVKAEKPLKAEKVAKVDTYIMNATHLSWGQNGKNHFFAAKKPIISREVMGKYAPTLDIWIENGWVIPGKYSK